MGSKKEMIINVLISSIEKGDITGPIGVARLISELAHAGQYRDNGHCYFNHPHRCATMFYNLVSLNNNVNGEILAKHDIPYGVLEVAYLHDVFAVKAQNVTLFLVAQREIPAVFQISCQRLGHAAHKQILAKQNHRLAVQVVGQGTLILETHFDVF